MDKEMEKRFRAEERYFSNLAKAFIDRKTYVRGLPPYAPEIGFTSVSDKGYAEIYIARLHKIMESLDEQERSFFRLGVFAHESLHQIFTDFDATTKIINSYKRVSEKNIFAEVSNIVEDTRIEYFAHQAIGGDALAALGFTIKTIYMQSTLGEETHPVSQALNALIQLGDMGVIRGHFTIPEAFEIFKRIVPLFEKAVVMPVCYDALMVSKQICEILFEYIDFEFEDFLSELFKEASDKKQTGKGKDASPEEGDSEDGDSGGASSSGSSSKSKRSKSKKTIAEMGVSTDSSDDSESKEKGDKEDSSDTPGKAFDAEKDDMDSSSGKDGADSKSGSSGSSDSFDLDPDSFEDLDLSFDDIDGFSDGDHDGSDDGSSDKKGDDSDGKKESEDDGEGEGVSFKPSISEEKLAEINEILQKKFEEMSEEIMPVTFSEEIDAVAKAIEDEIFSEEREASKEKDAFKSSIPNEIAIDDPFVKLIVNKKMEACADSQYELVLSKVKPLITATSKAVERAMKQEDDEKLRHTSGEVNLYRYHDESYRSTRVFDKRREPLRLGDTCITILVDESGSMRGESAESARNTAVLLAEVCNKLKIPCYIIGYSADEFAYEVDLRHYVTWKNTKSDRTSLMQIRARCENRDGATIRAAIPIAKKRPEERKLLFVLSDGVPCASNYGGKKAILDTKNAIREARKVFTSVTGISIGRASTEMLHEMYGNDFISVPVVSMLPKEMSILFKKMFK